MDFERERKKNVKGRGRNAVAKEEDRQSLVALASRAFPSLQLVIAGVRSLVANRCGEQMPCTRAVRSGPRRSQFVPEDHGFMGLV